MAQASPRKISRIQERERIKTDTVDVTLRELHICQNGLTALARLSLRAPVAFRIAKICKAVGTEMEECETQRKNLLGRYAFLPEGENEYQFETPEKRTEFEREYQELLESSVTLNISPLKLNDLADATITPEQLLGLSWLVVE